MWHMMAQQQIMMQGLIESVGASQKRVGFSSADTMPAATTAFRKHQCDLDSVKPTMCGIAEEASSNETPVENREQRNPSKTAGGIVEHNTSSKISAGTGELRSPSGTIGGIGELSSSGKTSDAEKVKVWIPSAPSFHDPCLPIKCTDVSNSRGMQIFVCESTQTPTERASEAENAAQVHQPGAALWTACDFRNPSHEDMDALQHCSSAIKGKTFSTKSEEHPSLFDNDSGVLGKLASCEEPQKAAVAVASAIAACKEKLDIETSTETSRAEPIEAAIDTLVSALLDFQAVRFRSDHLITRSQDRHRTHPMASSRYASSRYGSSRYSTCSKDSTHAPSDYCMENHKHGSNREACAMELHQQPQTPVEMQMFNSKHSGESSPETCVPPLLLQ